MPGKHKEVFIMKRAVVTGATGFIGRHLVAELLRREWEVVCLGLTPWPRENPAVRFVPCDLLKPETMRLESEPLGNADVFFHLGAIVPGGKPSSVANERDYLQANGVATHLLLQLAVELSIPSFVYASSLSPIGKPEILPITEEHPVPPAPCVCIEQVLGRAGVRNDPPQHRLESLLPSVQFAVWGTACRWRGSCRVLSGRRWFRRMSCGSGRGNGARTLCTSGILSGPACLPPKRRIRGCIKSPGHGPFA